jgi:hypothetical protein
MAMDGRGVPPTYAPYPGQPGMAQYPPQQYLGPPAIGMPQYAPQQYPAPGYGPAAAPARALHGPIHTAFFSNILFSTTIEEFTNFAREYGEIANVYSLISTKGYAFVTYFDLRNAQKAVDQANNRPLGGRAVRTNYAVKSNTPF